MNTVAKIFAFVAFSVVYALFLKFDLHIDTLPRGDWLYAVLGYVIGMTFIDRA